MPPKFGDRVVVYPAPGLRVQVDGIHGRFLPAQGQEVLWSEWWHRRYQDGSALLHDPNVKGKSDAKPEPEADKPKEKR